MNFELIFFCNFIFLLQEFISWLSSVSPEDSVLVCWDDEVPLSKLFCTCLIRDRVFHGVITYNAQADNDLQNI